jgi:hypothetical protein
MRLSPDDVATALTNSLLGGLIPTFAVFVAAGVVKLLTEVKNRHDEEERRQREHDHDRDLTVEEITNVLLGTKATAFTARTPGLIERVEALERATHP